MTKAEPTMTPEEEAEWAELLQRGELDVVLNKPAAPNQTPTIKDILLTRYPCQELPRGALQQIASEVGVSRERIRQVARTLGYIPFSKSQFIKKHQPRLCSDCGEREAQIHSTLCYDCAWPVLACDHCGAEFRRRRSVILRWARSYGRSAGRFAFCSQPCRDAAQQVQGFAHGVPKKYAGRWGEQHDVERKASVLNAIHNYREQHSRPPSVRDIAIACNMSDGAAYYWMRQLRREGKVDWVDGKARTLRVLEGAQ